MTDEISKRISAYGLLMTCIIVMYHCGSGNLLPFNEIDRKLYSSTAHAFNLLAVIAMNFFFATTGFLLFYKFNLKLYRSKIERRFISLFIPYTLWQLTYGIKTLKEGIPIFLHKIFSLQRWPPDGPLWYLYAVFLLSIFSPLFYMALKVKRVGSIFVFLIIFFMYLLPQTNNPILNHVISYGYVENILGYFPAYLLGLFFGLHGGETSAEENLSICANMIFTALILDFICSGFLLHFINCSLPILMLYALPVISKFYHSVFVNVVFIMYAIHAYLDMKLADQIRYFIFKFTSLASLADMGCRILCLAITMLCSLLFWIVLNRTYPQLLAVLTGGRAKRFIKQS